MCNHLITVYEMYTCIANVCIRQIHNCNMQMAIACCRLKCLSPRTVYYRANEQHILKLLTQCRHWTRTCVHISDALHTNIVGTLLGSLNATHHKIAKWTNNHQIWCRCDLGTLTWSVSPHAAHRTGMCGAQGCVMHRV